MPVHCEIRNGKYRIIEPSGGIAKSRKGNPVDGGGHSSKAACNSQARAINRSIHQSSEDQPIGLGTALKQKFSSRLKHFFRDWVERGIRSPGFPHYDAAKKNKLTKDWRMALTSADQAILGDLDSLMARSRSMLRNDGVSASGKKAFLRYVIGSGITARSAARDPHTGEMLDTYNEILDRLWNNWANNPNLCDQEKTKTLVEKEALWLSEEYAVGGIFIILNYVPNEEGVGLVLQEVECEQVDNTITSYEGRSVRGGIEVDKYGAPVAYHVYTTEHPLEKWSRKSERIPAERVIHIFAQERVRQKRGTPWMSGVMSTVRNLAIYEQSMLLKARTEAAYHGVVEQEATGGFGVPSVVARQIGAVPRTDESTATDTTANNIEVLIQPGLIPVLNPGQKMRYLTPGTPNTMYQPFVWEQLKRISAGVGLDLATVSRWYAEGNFSSQRQGKMELYAETDPIQALMINKPLRRIRNLFIELAIKEGRLKAVGYYETHTWKAAYQTTNWQGPPKPSIDAYKDAIASVKLLDAGLVSRQRYFNERGMEIRDVYAELEEDKKLQKKHGLDFSKKVLGPINPRGGMGIVGGDNGDSELIPRRIRIRV